MILTKTKLEMFLRGISQTEVARRAGFSKSYINRIVNEKQKPSAKAREALKSFGIQVEEKNGKG